MLIVTAMRTIGENNLTEEELTKIVALLQNVSASDFNHDIKLAPAWVRKILMTR